MFTRVLIFVSLFIGSAFAADLHEVRLLRPVKAGDQFDISAKVAFEDKMKTSLGGQEIESDETRAACRLTGVLTIVSVTKKGLPSAVKLKLKTVDCDEGGKPGAFFKEGDELFLRHGAPDNETQVNGEEADETQSQIIESLLSVEGEDEVTDEDVFGTKEKVAVGAEWPVNAKAAVDSLARNGVTGLDPKGVSGNTKLVSLGEFERQPALSLRMTAKIDGKDVKLSSLPENVKGSRFHSEYTLEMDLPADPASAAGRVKGLATMHVDAKGTEEIDGKAIDIAVKIERRIANEITATPAR